MIERLHKMIAVVFLTILIGCIGTSGETKTYFGGKVINPKGKSVILYQNYVAIDTFNLGINNKFLGEISNIKEGLYYFRHGNQYQHLYLEPKDSILIRVNYWDFDESLVFSGKGAFKNNLLLDCYLNTERERKSFRPSYELSPSEFKSKIDSIIVLKLASYEKLKKENPKLSESFLNIFKIALTYPVYGHIENYPMVHRAKKNEEIHKEINDDFYSYRKKISLNQDSIMYFNAYRNFVVNRIYNKVYSEGNEMGTDEFTLGILKTIAKDISNQYFKNRILRQTILRDFLGKSTSQYNQEIFQTYLSLTSSKEDKNLVTLLQNDIKKLNIDKKINNFFIKDYNHTDISIESIIKGEKAFVYFWNPRYSSRDYIASRVNYLSNKFPNIKFVGIKIDGDGKDKLKKIDIKRQYYLTSESDANKFLTSKMPRALIINERGILLNSYASLLPSKNADHQLKELSKK